MRRKIITLYYLSFYFLSTQGVRANAQSGFNKTVISSDGNLRFTFMTESNNDGRLQLFYLVRYKDKEVVQKSTLSNVLDNHLSELAMAIGPDEEYCFSADLELVSQKDTSVNTQWDNPFGERSVVTDNWQASQERQATPSFMDALCCLRRGLWAERIKYMFGKSAVHDKKFVSVHAELFRPPSGFINGGTAISFK